MCPGAGFVVDFSPYRRHAFLQYDVAVFGRFPGHNYRKRGAPGFDLDGNGQVDFPDFLILAEHYGQASP